MVFECDAIMWVTVTVRETRLASRHHHLHLQAHFQFWFSSPTIATAAEQNHICLMHGNFTISCVQQKSGSTASYDLLSIFRWISFRLQEVGCILSLLNIGDFIKDGHHYLSMTRHFGVVKYYLWLDQLVDIWSGKCFSLLKTMILCHSAYKLKSSTKEVCCSFSNWHQKRKVSKWATLSYTEYISYIDDVLSYWVRPPTCNSHKVFTLFWLKTGPLLLHSLKGGLVKIIHICIYIYISWYHTISAIVIAYTIPFPFFLLVGCWTNFQAKRAGEAGTAFERIQLVNAMMTPQVFTSLIIGVDVKAIIIWHYMTSKYTLK